MKLARFQFGLRFFLIAVVVSAFALIFIWEKANQPPVFRSNYRILGVATDGDISELEGLSLSPAQAMRSVNRDWANNVDLQKHIPSDAIWQSVDIEPLETVVEPPREVPAIGYVCPRNRDFRCTLEGVDSNGDEVNAIVIVNRNHFHIVDID